MKKQTTIKNITDNEIKGALKISNEVYSDFCNDINKKYPEHDFGLIAFNMFHDLATHLRSFNGWQTKDLVSHLVENKE